METPPGDSKKEKPVTSKDRRLPCSVVVFNQLTAIPGVSTMYTEVRAGDQRISEGKQFSMPMAFLDLEAQSIWIEGREYPLARVHYWERAKTAFVKPAAPPPHDYVIGKRAKRNPKDI